MDREKARWREIEMAIIKENEKGCSDIERLEEKGKKMECD